MAATAPGWSGTVLRSLAAWLTGLADALEHPVARVMALEPAPLVPSIDDLLAEMRTRAHIPYY